LSNTELAALIAAALLVAGACLVKVRLAPEDPQENSSVTTAVAIVVVLLTAKQVHAGIPQKAVGKFGVSFPWIQGARRTVVR
jgi:hypothetical protein